MGTRTNRGKVTVVSRGQTLSDGRPSRALDAGKLPHRPNLEGEEGAIAALVLALADPALFAQDDPGRASAMQAVRYGRKRVRRVLAAEEAHRVFALAQVTRRDLDAVSKAHETARARLIAGALDAVLTMREHSIVSTSARVGVATAKRMHALGSALLDVGSTNLDAKTLAAGAALIGAGRLELLSAFEVERRSKIDRPDPATSTRVAEGVRALDARLAARREAARTRENEDDERDPEDEGATDA